MSSPPDLAVVWRYVQRIGSGDLKAILACLHPDFVLNEPATLPYGGDHVGRDGFVGLAYGVAEHYLTELLDSAVHDAGEFAVCACGSGSPRNGRDCRWRCR
jgi:ketosteroid isomerase-like protein